MERSERSQTLLAKTRQEKRGKNEKMQRKKDDGRVQEMLTGLTTRSLEFGIREQSSQPLVIIHIKGYLYSHLMAESIISSHLPP